MSKFPTCSWDVGDRIDFANGGHLVIIWICSLWVRYGIYAPGGEFPHLRTKDHENFNLAVNATHEKLARESGWKLDDAG